MDYSYSISTTGLNPSYIAQIYSVYLIPLIVSGLVFYIYQAIAFMAIAKKTNTPNGWLAWIPIANLYLYTQIAKVPWWTMLVILLAWIPILGYLLVLGVTIWWLWKICENCGKPGWWSILSLIPFVGQLWMLIMIGILAWGKNNK